MSRTPPQEEPRFGPVRLPLYHTKGAPNEGVFKCTLHIGGNPIDVIIDSCSADLIVVGQQCNSSCQHTAGEYPKNKGQSLPFARQTSANDQRRRGCDAGPNGICWAADVRSLHGKRAYPFSCVPLCMSMPPLCICPIFRALVYSSHLRPEVVVALPNPSLEPKTHRWRPGALAASREVPSQNGAFSSLKQRCLPKTARKPIQNRRQKL